MRQKAMEAYGETGKRKDIEGEDDSFKARKSKLRSFGMMISIVKNGSWEWIEEKRSRVKGIW